MNVRLLTVALLQGAVWYDHAGLGQHRRAAHARVAVRSLERAHDVLLRRQTPRHQREERRRRVARLH